LITSKELSLVPIEGAKSFASNRLGEFREKLQGEKSQTSLGFWEKRKVKKADYIRTGKISSTDSLYKRRRGTGINQ